MKIIAYLLIFLLNGLRPLLGPGECKFILGCTDFAKIQLNEQPLPQALWNIFKRLLSCSPLGKP